MPGHWNTIQITTNESLMPRKKRNRIPNSIRRYRQEKAMRLCEVAHLARITSPADIAHWEKGFKAPNLVNALKLSAILQCPVEVLFLEIFNQIRHDIYLRKQDPIKKPL